MVVWHNTELQCGKNGRGLLRAVYCLLGPKILVTPLNTKWYYWRQIDTTSLQCYSLESDIDDNNSKIICGPIFQTLSVTAANALGSTKSDNFNFTKSMLKCLEGAV